MPKDTKITKEQAASLIELVISNPDPNKETVGKKIGGVINNKNIVYTISIPAGYGVTTPFNIEDTQATMREDAFGALKEIKTSFLNHLNTIYGKNLTVQNLENEARKIANDTANYLRSIDVSEETISTIIDLKKLEDVVGNIFDPIKSFSVSDNDLIKVGALQQPQQAQTPPPPKPKTPPVVATAKNTPPAPAKPTNAGTGKPVLVLDFGHGWNGVKDHPGAQVKGVNETAIIGKVGEYLKVYLAPYFDLKDTRDREKVNGSEKEDFISRFKVADEANADLYISLHADSNSSKKELGVICYYDQDEPSSIRNKTIGIAKEISEKCGSKINPREKNENRGPIQKKYIKDGRKTLIYDIPAILIELGNMQSDSELALMQDDAWAMSTAQKIAAGIIDGYNKHLSNGKPLQAEIVADEPTSQPEFTQAPPQPTPQPTTPTNPDEDLRQSIAGAKPAEDLNLMSGLMEGNIGKIGNFFTGDNGLPMTYLVTMIVRFFASLVDLIKATQGIDIDIPNDHKEALQAQVTKDCMLKIKEMAEGLGFDNEKSRIAFASEEAFKNFNKEKDNIMKEAAEFFSGKVKEARGEDGKKELTTDQLSVITEELGKFLSEKITSSFTGFGKDNFVSIQLEKDGKTAYFSDNVLKYFTPEEVAAMGNSSYQPLKDYNGVYWHLVPEDNIGRS